MKKMFLALALFVVAPVVVADETKPTESTTEQKDGKPAEKGYLEKAKGACCDAAAFVTDSYNNGATAVEDLFCKLPGSSYVSDYVVAPAKNNFKAFVVLVAVVTAIVANQSSEEVEAEL